MNPKWEEAGVEPLIRADEAEFPSQTTIHRVANRAFADGAAHAEAVAARLVEVICEQEAEPRCRTCGIRTLRAQIAADITARLCDPYCHVGACHGLHEAARIALAPPDDAHGTCDCDYCRGDT
jgi:hypothetical protein